MALQKSWKDFGNIYKILSQGELKKKNQQYL